MKKWQLGIVAGMMILIIVFCGAEYFHSAGRMETIEYGSSEDEEQEVLIPSSSDDVYNALGMGINIGNNLDVCDWTYFGSKHISGFQTAIVYNSAPWTAWDVSKYEYFDGNNELTLEWEIKSLESDPEAAASSFALQLINHTSSCEGTNVTCKVKDAKLVYENGIEVPLSSGSGSYTFTVQNDVTDYFKFDLRNLGIKTKNLIGSTVSISLEISDYYDTTKEKIAALEQMWGNPVITEDFIYAIRDAGFTSVRVPVTYFNHISDDGTIDEEYLDRVEQVVDWVLDSGMYCITDMQHDTGNDGWIVASESNYNANKDTVSNIFRQIAERFKDKSDHLILEGLNEVVNDKTQWQHVPKADFDVMNKWNQLFVDTVRSTGGMNASRYLLVNTYAALPLEECLSAFVMPVDSVENRIMVGVHCYFKLEDIEKSFNTIEKYSSQYDIVVGEWAVWKKNDNRQEIIDAYIDQLNRLGLPAMWWDNGRSEETAIFDRKKLSVAYPDIENAITGKQ